MDCVTVHGAPGDARQGGSGVGPFEGEDSAGSHARGAMACL